MSLPDDQPAQLAVENDVLDQRYTKLKDGLDIAQSLATIIAIIVGGIWTYKLFVEERHHYPHANLEHGISHISLSKHINVLNVVMTVKNTGTSMLEIKKMLLRVQQILPVLPCVDKQPCAVEQVNKALREVERTEDRFSWPLISEKTSYLKAPMEIEPSEEDQMDFEFAIPSNVTSARIYSYIRNEAKDLNTGEIGWFLSSYYSFDSKMSKQE